MKVLFVLLLALPSLMCQIESSNINKRIVRNIDVTNDGTPDSIILSINAQNWDSPFECNLKIKADDKIIYSYNTFDEQMEYYFTKEFSPECKTPSEAKQKYYIDSFLGMIIRNDIDFGVKSYIFNPDYDGSVFKFTSKFLRENSDLSEDVIHNIINRIVEDLKNNRITIISHRIKFLHTTLPMVYIPEIQKFVPIYSC